MLGKIVPNLVLEKNQHTYCVICNLSIQIKLTNVTSNLAQIFLVFRELINVLRVTNDTIK